MMIRRRQRSTRQTSVAPSGRPARRCRWAAFGDPVGVVAHAANPSGRRKLTGKRADGFLRSLENQR
jgi:hypothetical protein